MDWDGFSGLPPAPPFTPLPNIVLDLIMPALGEAELRVLLFLCRQIYGWHRTTQHVSLSQMVTGIQRVDGTWMNQGTGLTRRSVIRAVQALEQKGLILVERDESLHRDKQVNRYRLRVQGGDAPTLPLVP